MTYLPSFITSCRVTSSGRQPRERFAVLELPSHRDGRDGLLPRALPTMPPAPARQKANGQTDLVRRNRKHQASPESSNGIHAAKVVKDVTRAPKDVFHSRAK